VMGRRTEVDALRRPFQEERSALGGRMP
jgi:hypothetical protein